MFGWMSVNRGLSWYSRLLNLAMKNLEDEDVPGSVSIFPFILDKFMCVTTLPIKYFRVNFGFEFHSCQKLHWNHNCSKRSQKIFLYLSCKTS